MRKRTKWEYLETDFSELEYDRSLTINGVQLPENLCEDEPIEDDNNSSDLDKVLDILSDMGYDVDDESDFVDGLNIEFKFSKRKINQLIDLWEDRMENY